MTSSNKKGKPFLYYMRALHRDIGFIVIGLTLVYCLSGIILMYRDRGFFRNETKIDRTLPANLKPHDIGKYLKIRKFRITKVKDNIVHFKYGTYNIKTGATHERKYSYPSFIQKMNKFHMQASHRFAHIFALIYGILLTFLALSSFWMYKPGTKNFKRGIYLSVGGAIITLLILFIWF